MKTHGIVRLFDRGFGLRNAFYRDKWFGPETRDAKVPLMYMHDVASTLPRDVPVAHVRPSRVSAPLQEKTLEWLRRYMWYELRRLQAAERPSLQRAPADNAVVFQDGLRSSMAMMLHKPGARADSDVEANAGTEAVPGEFVLDLTYHGIQVRPEVEPIDCIAHFSRRDPSNPDWSHTVTAARSDPENDLIVTRIVHQGTVYSRSHPDFAHVSDILLTSLLTTGTIQHHFLYTHVLTGATIYSTAAHHLSRAHPIYVFVHPHGYEIARGNVYKAKILVRQSLVSDWSFDEPALRLLLSKWTTEFRLSDLLPMNVMRRSGFTPATMHRCPSLDRAMKMWLAFERYATAWVDETYGASGAEERIVADQELSGWYSHLARLPFGVVPGPTLDRQNLIRLLASYIYVCVFYHQVFGDEPKTRELVQRADLIVPKRPQRGADGEHAQRFVSRQIFHVIFQSVIEKHESFADPKWPKSLPPAYRTLVEDLQRQVKAISPERWEIGINK